MRAARTMAVLIILTLVSVAAEAAPVTLLLVRTSPLFNLDPPGAPLPLGRTQFDGGDVMVNNQKIGEYLILRDVNAGGLNVAAMTITLFFGTSTAPSVITLQGVHSFTNGRGTGSISASSFAGVSGITFASAPGPAVGQINLTINFP